MRAARDEAIHGSRCTMIDEMLQFPLRERDFHKNRFLDSDATYGADKTLDED